MTSGATPYLQESTDAHEGRARTRTLTALYVDGNSLSAAAVTLSHGHKPRVEFCRTIEFPDLLERVERFSHPIFMDTDILRVPDLHAYTTAVRSLLDHKELQHPLLVVLPGDVAEEWFGITEPTMKAEERSLASALKALLHGNPRAYPRVIASEAHTVGAIHKRVVQLWACRFDDVATLVDPIGKITTQPLLGVVTGTRALGEWQRLAPAADRKSPLALVDIGKLRSGFCGGIDGHVLFSHGIPVGLGRDDADYFNSFVPMFSQMFAAASGGVRILPPEEMTPLPLFVSGSSTPQADMARFATQVANSLERLVRETWSGANSTSTAKTALVSGMPARLPGLMSYLMKRAKIALQPAGPWMAALVDVAPGIDSDTIADHAVPIGAVLAFTHRRQSRHGMLLRDRRPIPVPTPTATAAALKHGQPLFIASRSATEVGVRM